MQTSRLWVEPIIGGLFILIAPSLWIVDFIPCDIINKPNSPFYSILPYLVVLVLVIAYVVGTIANDLLRFFVRDLISNRAMDTIGGSSSGQEDGARRNFIYLLANGSHDAVASVRGTYDTLVLFRLFIVGSLVLFFTLPAWMYAKNCSLHLITLAQLALTFMIYFLGRLYRRYNGARIDHLASIVRNLKVPRLRTVSSLTIR
jgi:hypothetical protein